MAMNHELSTLLSAYLDGELDGEARRLVEQSLRSDPALTDQLASLARVRDLVATLSTPDPVGDASGRVLATLARRSEARRVARRRAVAVISILVPGLAAAVLLLMVSFRGKPAGTPPDRDAIGPTVAFAPAPPAPLVLSPRPARPVPSIATADVAIPKERLVAEMKARADREELDRLLGREDVRQITVVVDNLAPSTLRSFDEILSKSNRRKPEHARVRLVRSVSNDPRSTAPACFYVVTMDEIEHNSFLSKLKEQFPDSSTDAKAVSPQSVASISQIGQVEILQGEARATLLAHPPAETPELLALGGHEPTTRRVKVGPIVPEAGPTSSKSVSDASSRPLGGVPKAVDTGPVVAVEPGRRREDHPSDADRRRHTDDEPPAMVYVVWLTARERSRP